MNSHVKVFFLALVLIIASSQLYADCTLPRPSISTSSSVTFCTGGSVTLTSSTGSGYAYQWKKNNVSISGATNSTYTANTSGSYTVKVTVDTCDNTSLPMVVTVNPKPVIVTSNDTTVCAGEPATLSASGGVSYSWNNSGETTASIIVFPTFTRTYSVTVTNSYNCSDVAFVTVNVIPLPQASITATGSTTLCQGQTVTLTTASGNSYQWKRNGNNISGAPNANTYNTGQAGVYSVLSSANGCSKLSPDITVTVNPLPVVTVSNDTTVCAGDPVNLTASGGGTYAWSINGLTTSTISLNPTVTRTYTVTVTSAQSCIATGSATVNVIPLPQNWTSISGTGVICQGQSININAATGTGYSHQWKKDGNDISGSTSTTYSANQQGSYSVMITANGCSKESGVVPITVNPVPVITVSSDTTICSGDTVILSASGGTGYQWTPGGPAAATFTVAPSTTKAYTVNVTNSFGCSKTGSVTVSVIPLPTTTVYAGGSTTLCQGQSVNINATNGTGYSYQWKKDGTEISGANSSTYSTNQQGNYSVMISANGCSKESGIVPITINPVPIITVSSDTTICSGDTVILSASGGTSYQWTPGGPAAATFKVAPTSTKAYMVNVINFFGCSKTGTITVSVIPLPAATIFVGGSTTICQNQSVGFSANTGTGYTYQWLKDGNNISGATNLTYTATQTGTYAVKVTSNGCGKTAFPVSVTVNPLPVPVLSNDTTICSKDTISISASGGTSYVWSTGASQSQTQVSPVQTTHYKVTVTDANNCSKSDSVIISTIALPDASVTLSGSSSLCSGQSLTIQALNKPGYSYQWKNGASILNGEVFPTYTTTFAGNYYAIVMENGCRNFSDTIEVAVHPNPVVTTSNDTLICSGNSVILSASGGSQYQWSNGQTGSPVSVSPNTTSIYTVTVTTSFGCSKTDQITVSVIPTPVAVISTSASSNLCAGQTALLNAATGGGYAYQWKNNGVNIPGETSPAFTATQSGIYTVYVSAFGCAKTSAPFALTVNANPEVTISNDTTICSETPITLSATGGATYQWSSGNSGASITVTPTATTTYNVTVTNTASCTAVDEVTVGIILKPIANLSTTGSNTLCQGQTVALNASTGTGYSYQWMKDVNVISGITSSNHTTGDAGLYKVIVTQNGCSKTSNALTVIVNPMPVAVISTDASICAGDSITVSASGGTNYTWNTGSHASSITVVPLSSKTYTVTVTYGGQCSDVASSFVTVNPVPNAFITNSGTVNLCEGLTVTLYANTGTGYNYEWFLDNNSVTGADSSILVTTTAGNYSVIVSNSAGCSKQSAVKQVTWFSAPVVSISNDTAVCAESSVLLEVSGGDSYQWSTWVGDSLYLVEPTSSKTYLVTVTDGNGCRAFDSVRVTILALPSNVQINISSSATICEGNSLTLSTNNTAGNSYQWLRDSFILPDASQSTFAAGEAGSYNVKVTGSNGCSKTSNPMEVTVMPKPDMPSIVKIGEDSLWCTVAGTNYKWYRNGIVVATGIQQIKASKSGEYRVLVFENNCASDTSASFGLYGTGIQQANSNELSIYPNPTDGMVTIELPTLTGENIQLQLYDAIGNLVYENIFLSTNYHFSKSINISNYSSGIYFLNIETSEGKIVRKVVLR